VWRGHEARGGMVMNGSSPASPLDWEGRLW